MAGLPLIFGGVVAVIGALTVLSAFRKPAIDIGAVLAELNGDELIQDAYARHLNAPLVSRIFGPPARKIASAIRSLLPHNYREHAKRKLILAGLDNIGAEEFVAIQAVAAGVGILFALLIATMFHWGHAGTLRAIPILGGTGALLPVEWRQRKRGERATSMRRDLPDVLDLLAISVEAGVGLEGAIQVVGNHFDSPLAHELQRLLREMELGVSRRAALKSLRARVDIPEVGQFILALIQADALGMPLGKVLRVQATQMRAKRRQWARERAAKLPVKIIFPLLGFILPALFVVVLGPAVQSIAKNVLHR